MKYRLLSANTKTRTASLQRNSEQANIVAGRQVVLWWNTDNRLFLFIYSMELFSDL